MRGGGETTQETTAAAAAQEGGAEAETEAEVSDTGYEGGSGMIVSTEPTDIVSSKDSMIVVVPADPGSLDPHDSVTQNKHQSTRQIYETLVVYD